MQLLFRAVHYGVPQGLVILQALFNHFISVIPVPTPNIASYADNLIIFVSSPRLDAAEAELAVLLQYVLDWSAAKKLGVAPGKSCHALHPRYPPTLIPPTCHYLQ
jgi:hypothetical protein